MESYIVKKGDTLDKIATLYGIPAIEIIRANNLKDPYTLTIGEVLDIPTGTFNIYDYYVVKTGDTLYNVSNMSNTNIDTLLAINGLDKNDYIYPNQTLLVPKQGVRTYITKEGDTLEDVSRYFKVSPLDILYSNNNIFLLPEQLVVYRKI